jgi:hypothetical protein
VVECTQAEGQSDSRIVVFGATSRPALSLNKRENISPTFLSYPDEADSKRNDVDKRLFVLIKAAKCLGQQGSGGDYASGQLPGADVVEIL